MKDVGGNAKQKQNISSSMEKGVKAKMEEQQLPR